MTFMASDALQQSCLPKPKQNTEHTHTWSTKVTYLLQFQGGDTELA